MCRARPEAARDQPAAHDHSRQCADYCERIHRAACVRRGAEQPSRPPFPPPSLPRGTSIRPRAGLPWLRADFRRRDHDLGDSHEQRLEASRMPPAGAQRHALHRSRPSRPTVGADQTPRESPDDVFRWPRRAIVPPDNHIHPARRRSNLQAASSAASHLACRGRRRPKKRKARTTTAWSAPVSHRETPVAASTYPAPERRTVRRR